MGVLLATTLLLVACSRDALPPDATILSDMQTERTDGTILSDMRAARDAAILSDMRAVMDLASPCACAAGQLCVVPTCRPVLGEECWPSPDGSAAMCLTGEREGFTSDCPAGAIGCVSACHVDASGNLVPDPPFCVDVPGACSDAPTCACFGADPCGDRTHGVCTDGGFHGAVLACSL